MIFFRKHFFCFLLLVAPLFSLFSCDDEEGEKEYSVDSELYPYLQRFLDEAAKRGKSFDVVGDGLIMEFADLESPVVGLCTYSNPIKVQIDKKYWKETANSANQENLREDVVFHELGHGLLRRSHDNSTLPNTEWKTIMCGGTEVDGRSWAVNFNGARKKYYLDELFAMTVGAPDYTKVKSLDVEKGVKIYGEDYAKMQDGEEERISLVVNQVKDGLLHLSSTYDGNLLCALLSDLSSEDFFFEVEMRADGLKSSGLTGLFVSSYTSSSTTSTNYFSLTNKNRVDVMNSDCIYPFAEVLVDDYCRVDDFNKFSLRKVGDDLYFYINDMLVYWNDYALDAYTSVGIILPKESSVELKNYAYYTNEGLKSSSEGLRNSSSFPELRAVPLVQKSISNYCLIK